MSLSIKTRKEDGVNVLELSGRLTIGESVLSLRDAVRSAVDDGDLKFVLNLGDVSYIDSSGLGELVSIYTTVRNKKGDVKLLKLTAKAKDLLQMTKTFDSFRHLRRRGRRPRCTQRLTRARQSWRKCVGVEPTGRRFPDIPLALKARRVTGPYSLPSKSIITITVGWKKSPPYMAKISRAPRDGTCHGQHREIRSGIPGF